MEVIKKDGRTQVLNKDKIKVSIENATQGIEIVLNESDINILVKDIGRKIEKIRTEFGNTSSYEIIGVVVETLSNNGFHEIVSSYLGYKK